MKRKEEKEQVLYIHLVYMPYLLKLQTANYLHLVWFRKYVLKHVRGRHTLYKQVFCLLLQGAVIEGLFYYFFLHAKGSDLVSERKYV